MKNTTTAPKTAIQLTESLGLGRDAQDALDALKLQDGFLYGRVTSRNDWLPGSTVQAFFADEGDEMFMDGMRRVVITHALAAHIAAAQKVMAR